MSGNNTGSYRGDIKDKDVLEYLAQGNSAYQAARHFRCEAGLIYSIKKGTRKKPPPTRARINGRRIRALHKKGLNYTEIGKRTGHGYYVIYSAINGEPPPSYKRGWKKQKAARRAVRENPGRRKCRRCGNLIDNQNYFFCSLCHPEVGTYAVNMAAV